MNFWRDTRKVIEVKLKHEFNTDTTAFFTLINYEPSGNSILKYSDHIRKYITPRTEFITFFFGTNGLAVEIEKVKGEWKFAGDYAVYCIIRSCPKFWTELLIDLKEE